MACENLSEADKVVATPKALDGVESVRMGVMKESILVQDWLFGEIHKCTQVDREVQDRVPIVGAPSTLPKFWMQKEIPPDL